MIRQVVFVVACGIASLVISCAVSADVRGSALGAGARDDGSGVRAGRIDRGEADGASWRANRPDALDAEGLRPRAKWIAEDPAVITVHHVPEVIYVKFHDDLLIRLVDGRPSDLGTGVLRHSRLVLDGLPAREWARVHTMPEDRLETMRSAAEARLGRRLADLNTEYFLFLHNGADAPGVIGLLNGLDVVEYAAPMPRPVPPPLPPDFESSQGYLNESPAGIDTRYIWENFGTRGAGMKIANLEYSFDANHADLPAVQIIGFTPVDPGFGPDHGTAVLGVLGSQDNGWGTTGIAPDADLYFRGTYNGSSWNVGGAVIAASSAMNPGDVILIEQQMAGPNVGDNQFGLVPIEWWAPWYNAVLTAVGNGSIVVMAAGNGSQNLDAPEYGTGNGGHWPFLPENDSGAIVVGAGAAPALFGGSAAARSRLGFSNYGSRVNLQGWGQAVFTTGYGGAYSAMGPNFYYTNSFGGTSSASPIVAGACALLQAVYKQQNDGAVLSSPQIREILINTGVPQQGGASPEWQQIGPLPNLRAAVLSMLPVDCPMDLSGPSGTGLNGTVYAMTPFDDGSGEALYFAGTFTTAGGELVNRVARWDGQAWSALQSPGQIGVDNEVRALAVFDDGSGPALYAGGSFANAGGQQVLRVARWDGQSWSPLTGPNGTGVNGTVRAMTVYDDGNGPALYVGGQFTHAGGVGVNGIARWDGQAWSAVTDGIGPVGMNNPVHALSVYDDGNGAALYAGGMFTTAGGLAVSRIARWNGSNWSALSGPSGTGVSGEVRAMGVFENNLYVGGTFLTAGGVTVNRIARWDGQGWSSLSDGGGIGLDASVHAIAVHNDGAGDALYVGGAFTSAAGIGAERVARWSGNAWSVLSGLDGDGLNASAHALRGFDDGSGSALFVGGDFVLGAGQVLNYCARWTGCPEPGPECPADLTGPALDGAPDGTVNAFDLNYYITLWLAGDSAADLTGSALDGTPDGTVNAFDLNYYLDLWLSSQGQCP